VKRRAEDGNYMIVKAIPRKKLRGAMNTWKGNEITSDQFLVVTSKGMEWIRYPETKRGVLEELVSRGVWGMTPCGNGDTE